MWSSDEQLRWVRGSGVTRCGERDPAVNQARGALGRGTWQAEPGWTQGRAAMLRLSFRSGARGVGRDTWQSNLPSLPAVEVRVCAWAGVETHLRCTTLSAPAADHEAAPQRSAARAFGSARKSFWKIFEARASRRHCARRSARLGAGSRSQGRGGTLRWRGQAFRHSSPCTSPGANSNPRVVRLLCVPPANNPVSRWSPGVVTSVPVQCQCQSSVAWNPASSEILPGLQRMQGTE